MHPRKETELCFQFAATHVRICLTSRHGPKVRRQLALQIFRALKRELKVIRDAELDDERCYIPLYNRPLYANLYQSVPEDAFLGRIVRLQRQKRGLTQPQFARLFQVSERTILRIEKGRAWPSERFLWLFEKEFGLNMERIVRQYEEAGIKPAKSRHEREGGGGETFMKPDNN